MNLHVSPQVDLLQLEGLRTRSIDTTSYEDEVFITADGTYQKDECPHCGAITKFVHSHGSEKQTFKDVSAWGKKVSILVDRRRFRCILCSKTWSEPIPSLHTKRLMTARLANHLIKRCLQGTNTDVARDIGIDEGTVRNVFRDYVSHKKASTRFATPQVLGIDEIHLLENRCVLTNIGEKTLFDILPSRTKDKLVPYFRDMPDKHNVEVIVADMWRPYHQLAAQFFPERPVVVDKFHIVRMANKGLDNVRKKVGKSRTPEERIRLKDERFLLYKRRNTLNEGDWDRVREWLRAFPLLNEAYKTKERFFEAFDEPDRKSGERAIDRCILAIPPALDPYFAELITAVGNWKRQILNYFEFHVPGDPSARITNAYTESMNSLIREVDRLGRGYSFEVMRARMLYDDIARVKKTSTRGRRPVDDATMSFANAFEEYAFDEDVEFGAGLDELCAQIRQWPTAEQIQANLSG